MRTLKLLACLMDYPSAAMWQAKAELMQELEQLTELQPAELEVLRDFMRDYFELPLLEAQAEYSATFDVGHTTSLLLFEHVHGDSRDRGQAMVDLLAEYEKAGLELAAKQLPDYLPLFLEYVALLPDAERKTWLNNVAMIVRLLEFRLAKKQSRYQSIFGLLFALCDCQVNEESLKSRVEQEKPDNTPEALDKVWQEEQVLFKANSACQDEAAVTNIKMQQTPTYYVNVGEDKRSQA